MKPLLLLTASLFAANVFSQNTNVAPAPAPAPAMTPVPAVPTTVRPPVAPVAPVLPAVTLPVFAPDALVPAPTLTNFWNTQLRSAKRIISGRTIDIAPLIRWYQRPAGGRPLTAWKLVTGRVTGQNSYGWVVAGYLDSQPQARPFTIKNPPLEARNEFTRLKAQFAQLLRAEEQSKADVAQAQELYDLTAADYQRFGYVRFGGDLLDQRQSALNRLKAAAARAGNEIQLFDAAGQDPRGEFTVRCFVVKTGIAFNGTLVYDHGYVTR